MNCPSCGSENRAGRKFCGACGAPLNVGCPSCGAGNEPTEKFCGDCGVGLAGKVQSGSAKAPAINPPSPNIRVRPELPDASTVIDGERKTVTALFADIKGSTELMEDLDPEEARAIIDPALKLMIEAVRRYDGYVVQSTGDGIFALFGAPVAHEDHPQRALYAALRLQEELKRYSAKVVADGGTPIQGRVGINTGEVVVRSIQTGDGSGRVHADWTYHQPRLADADGGAGRFDRGEREYPQALRRLFHPEAAGRDQSQRCQRGGQRLRGDRARPTADTAATRRRTWVDQVCGARARDGGA